MRKLASSVTKLTPKGFKPAFLTCHPGDRQLPWQADPWGVGEGEQRGAYAGIGMLAGGPQSLEQ